MDADMDRAWLSLHIFYAGDADPLLAGCVDPLVRELRERSLISQWFFVRYWLEGPHVRLRLLPAPGVPAATVAERAEVCVARFLDRQPSPEPEPEPEPAPVGGTDAEQATYRRWFLSEYSQQQWDSLYGPDGTMPVRSNNTYRPSRYEPEFDRYGGPAGVALAEWHFESSSDLVLAVLGGRRLTPGARVGLAVQLGLVQCLAFLDDAARVAAFLTWYRDSWERAYLPGADDLHAFFDTAYRSKADRLRTLVAQVRAGQDAAAPVGTGSPILRWLAHCRALRERALHLAATGGVSGLETLLHSYLHMTNNRLGITIVEEPYVAHVIRAAMNDHAEECHELGR